MRRIRRLAPAILLFGLAAVSRAGVVYVDADAAGPAHDGSSWTDAFLDLQAALAAAGPGDEIWVAAGTYRPASAARGTSFALKDGVGVYGGFAGAETLRTQRDPAAHETILSGEIGSAGVADDSYHVVTTDSSVAAGAVLDGFTVRGGNASGAAAPDNRGAGILVAGGSPTFANLLVTQNHADDRGGGMRIEAGNPSLAACRFLSNSSGVAGGAFSSASASAVALTGAIFRGNATGAGRGGGIDANRVSAKNCVVAGNSPNGAYIAQDGAGFVNCTFTGNSAAAIFFNGATSNGIVNSILYGDALGEIALGFSAGVAVSYSDVQGGGFVGAGNVDANPLFENSPGGDFRLGAGSPAVDAGNNAAAAGLTADAAGLPRFFDDPGAADTGSGSPPLVDMGAHERVPLSVTAPANVSVCAGAPASFSVTAVGQPTLAYRWRKGGVPLSNGGAVSGADTDALAIDPTAAGDSGSYDVAVTDGFGQTKTSASATLAVNAFPGAPAITAPKSVVVGATGASASVPAHAGSTFSWTLSGGTITSGQGTSQVGFSAGSAGTTMALSVVETGTGGCASPASAWKVQVDFADVPPSYLFHDAVVAVARAGVTTGCGGGNYCPGSPVTRDAMAVFILRGEHGGGYNPPAAVGNVFSDVTAATFLAKWMEQFGREGISTGCGGGAPPPYCPSQAVTRDAMAVFLLRGKHGAAFAPPAATGTVFCDVGAATFLAKWMEELKTESITGGCGSGACGKPNFCPGNTVTRGEMAAFIKKTFGLP